MKRLVLLLLFSLACASARAEWKDVKAGLDVKAILQVVGTPLMASKSRSGTQVTWTYDAGGYILFENGRVSYWRAPRAKRV